METNVCFLEFPDLAKCFQIICRELKTISLKLTINIMAKL